MIRSDVSVPRERGPDDITIRSELRAGDFGRVIALHGQEYQAQHGYDLTFEALVCHTFGAFQDPALLRAARLWLAERGDELVGSIAIVPRGGSGAAQLRWFLVAAEAQGRGLGRRLLEAALAHCRQQAFTSVMLETVSELEIAAALYTGAGFAVEHAEPMLLGGRSLTYQRYRLALT